jgi:hypothetical protein
MISRALLKSTRISSRVFDWLAGGVILTLLSVVFWAAAAQAQDEGDIFLDPVEGKLGDKVEVSGAGFDAGTYLYLYFSADKANLGSSIDGTVTRYKLLERNIRTTEETDPLPGEFDTYFMVPDALDDGEDIEDVHGDEYYVYVTYRISKQIIALAAFDVSPGEIELTPEAGKVGSEINISGEGVRPDQRITIEYDGTEVSIISGDTRTDADGEFSSTIVIPEVPAGEYTITAIDESGNRPEAEFRVIPEIAVSPTSQDVDKSVEVRGTGFAARERLIVTLDGIEVVTIPVTLHTTRSGILGGSFVIPPRPAYIDGSLVRVGVRDESNNAADAELTVLPIPATISLSPDTSPVSPGHVGMELTVSGIWFVPGAAINITYGDGEAVPVATTEALDSRNFSVTFTVPPSVSGSHEVVASDGINSVTAVFTMESERPLTPWPQSPTAAAAIEAGTTFDWGDVSDPSGITYVLQIAADSDFTALVLEKKELADSEYTPDTEESLRLVKKETPYYWRVKAVDGAFSESYWMVPSPFYVGTSQGTSIPGWIKYSGIGVGCGLAAFFIIRAQKKRAGSL